jgi:hypothetical protein
VLCLWLYQYQFDAEKAAGQGKALGFFPGAVSVNAMSVNELLCF